MNGKTSQGVFTTAKITGSTGSVGHLVGKGIRASASQITIGSDPTVAFYDSWRNDYLFVVSAAYIGQQHGMLSYFNPNTNVADGYVIGTFNKDDSAVTSNFYIYGFLIPKALCRNVDDAQGAIL